MSRWASRGVGAVGAAIVLVLVLVLGVAGPAAVAVADEPGRGRSSGATSLLGVALGDDELLLSLVTEEASASTDPANSGPSATERVAPLGVASSLVPALAMLSQPTIEAHHTSGEATEVTPGIDLATLAAGGAVPGLLAGTVDPVTLRSAVDADGAVSAASGAVRDLSVLGGLLNVDLVEAVLGAAALKDSAGADRHVHVDEVVALDLGALLASLGISLGDLPIDTAIDLLGALGVPLPGGASPAALATDIADLRSTLADARSQHEAAGAALVTAIDDLAIDQALLDECVAACDALVAAVAEGEEQVNVLTGQVAALGTVIDDATDELAGLLDGIVGGLDGAALLVLEDIDVHLIASAAGSMAASVAAVEMSVGDVRVGNVSLGGIDVGATLAELAAADTAVNAALATVLGPIDPSLEDLVDVQLFDRQTSITPGASGITASASFTGLRVTITPPSTCDLLGSLVDVQDSIEAVLDDLGLDLPNLPTEAAEVLSALGSTVDCTEVLDSVVSALTQPLRVEALSVSGSGFYAGSASSSPPSVTLPVTGGAAQLPLVLVLGGLGLGAGWMVRRAASPLARD